MSKKFSSNDYCLIFSVLSLLIIGIIVIASVSAVPAQEKLNNPYYYIFRYIIYIIVGISFGFLSFKINLNFIKKYSSFFLLMNILMLLLVFKFGFSAGGATRWLAIGPITIQPSEFLKLTFLIFFCSWLSKIKEKSVKRKKKLGNDFLKKFSICLLFFAVSSFFLIKQPDASNLIILFFTLLTVYFASGTPLWHIFSVSFLGFLGLFALIKFAPYRLSRLHVLLNSDIDPMGIGYQIKQISIAIGSGGLFGLGWGMSRQKLGFLPEPMTDAVFAVIGEEAGFIGAGLVIILFIVFLWSGLSICKNCPDKFLTFLSLGIVSWIMIQAMVNMGAMLKIFPLTGVALPFISYGGSHIVSELIAVGLLLNISRKSRIK